jgi:MFS family permease
VLVERRTTNPMLPLALFRSREFSAANAVTFLLYAAISGALFLLVVELQTVSGFSALLAGTALLPITVVVLTLASRFGALSQRIGARLPMTIGPLICGVGLLGTLRLTEHARYLTDVLPAVATFGLGLALFVAPLTATVLGAAPAEHAGAASGVNNAIARAAGLISIAALPVVSGLVGNSYTDPRLFLPAFRTAIWICVALMLLGSVLAAVTIGSDRRRARPAPATSPAAAPATDRFCVLDAPPLSPAARVIAAAPR